MIYFSVLKGLRVFDAKKRVIGKISDFAFVDGDKYAKIHSLVVLDGKNSFVVPLGLVKSWEGSAVLSIEKTHVERLPFTPSEYLISAILDKQIVDVDGIKVVRVNDIIFSRTGMTLLAIGVCVGTRSFFRRLTGIETGLNERVISWDSVAALSPEMHQLHVKEKRSKIAELHPRDIADILEDLNHKEMELVLKSLSDEKAAETIMEADPETQQAVLKTVETGRLVEILEEIQPDLAADILNTMNSKQAREILSRIEKPVAVKIKEFLNYPEDSAGGLMHPDFVSVKPEHTAEQVIRNLRKIKPPAEKIYHVYVTDKDGHLLGLVSLRALLIAQPRDKVSLFMKEDIVKIPIMASQEEIANSFSKYGIFALPVVDNNGMLKGVVEADDLIAEVIPDEWKKKTIKHQEKKKKTKRIHRVD